VHWSYLIEGWDSKPIEKTGQCKPGFNALARLWACTDALEKLPPGQFVKFYVDARYLDEGVDNKKRRYRYHLSHGFTLCASDEKAWQALDNAVARHEDIEWIYYCPRTVTRLVRRITMAKRKVAKAAD